MSQRNPLEPRPEEQDENLSFPDEFMQIVNTMAKEMFNDFASDARSHGFPSEVDTGNDDAGNPFVRVRFILDRTAQLDVDKTNECEFLLKGLLGDEKVEVNAAFDQRPATLGVRNAKLEIQQINQLKLESHLTDFLAAAMASRKGEPIPPAHDQEVAAPAPAPTPSPAASTPIPIIWKARSK